MQFKHLIWNLNKSCIDLANILINIVERYEKLDIGQTFDYASPIYMMDLNFHDLASSMGHLRLDEKTMHEIITGLDNLSKTQASIYYANKNDRFEETTSFILKYTVSSIKRDMNKRLTLMLSTSLVKILRENKGIFLKLYTHARYDLKSKYSTVLYDILSKKSKGSYTIATVFTIEEFKKLLDFDLVETNNFDSWTKINSNILSRAAKEINEKTNMYLTYTTIKDKTHSDKRTQTNSIKFETSLAPELEATDEYFTDDILMARKIEYYKEKEVDRKVRELKKFRSITIDDEENYKFKERQKLDKQHQEFEAQAKLQEWVNWVKYNNPTEHGLVCLINYESHEYVTINSIYKLMNIETNKILSSNARDTFIKVQNHINNDGDYGLVDVDYKKDYSISFSKG